MAGLFGSLAESGASPRVPVDLQASFRGSKVCRMHSGPSSAKPERVCPFLLAALSAGVKLPPTHVEASARALEQLRQTQTVNSAFQYAQHSGPPMCQQCNIYVGNNCPLQDRAYKTCWNARRAWLQQELATWLWLAI